MVHDSLKFVVEQLYPDAGKVRLVSESLNQNPENPVVKLELVPEDGKKPVTRLLFSPANRERASVAIPGSAYFLTLMSARSTIIREWASTVSILNEHDQVLAQETIKVNNPLNFSGYKFYQTEYDPQRPDYSGIGVSYQPALLPLYIGFIILTIGTFWMFYLDPKET